MSIVITSDFQASWNNLDTCDKAWNQALDICGEYNVKTLVFAGDGKHAYNPVDIRVIKWWQRSISKARHKGIVVLYVLGNHDRVGQFTDADNWLPVLRRAGAKTFDSIAVTDVGSFRVFVLPYSKGETVKDNAKKLLKWKPDKEKDILIFHCDVKNAKYNKLGIKSDASLSVDDLYCEHYLYCVGGHVHNPQLVEKNLYYVGSPYCTDWGEANQRKRFILVGDSGLTSIRSKIPGWYNTSWPDFDAHKVESFRGTKVKVEVEVEASEDYGRTLDHARRRAEKRFSGATIFVTPKFKDKRRDNVGISIDDSDERKIKEYIRRTVKDKDLRQRYTDYMVTRLGEIKGGLRRESKIKFLSAKARNFGPFEKIDIDYTKKGITLIQGINDDRNGKSNGSGKTTLNQIVPVSWFGRTFKEQTHDRWANRWNKDKAYAEVTHLDSNNHTIQTIRGRRPTMLKMLVNGKDQSSGMKSTDRNGTQRQIEQRTGFTWKTLANAVFIDRAIANAFLSGTNKDRTEVLSRFQNLERFAEALVLVKKDYKKNKESIHEVERSLDKVRSQVEESKIGLRNLKSLAKTQLDSALREIRKAKSRYKKWKKSSQHRINKYNKESQRLADKLVFVMKKVESTHKKEAKAKYDLDRINTEMYEWSKLCKLKECPTCHQKVSFKWVKHHTNDMEDIRKDLYVVYSKANNEYSKWLLREKKFEGRREQIEIKLEGIERTGRGLKISFETTEKQYTQISIDQHSARVVISKTNSKLKRLSRELKGYKKDLRKLHTRRKMYEYVGEAFSRDGIPAFLNRQLLPVLNKASDYYADLFSDKEIQVFFDIEDGCFVPQVFNAKGGETIGDQSEGEKALAGLITSFAFREAAPRTNLLILDEPGAGLDEDTARQFAKALKILVQRFKSIWIATHNQVILSELSGERVITVRKRNRLSKIVN